MITWLSEDVVLAIHDAQLAEHGGGKGLRDAGLLSSALARPQNLLAYADPDIAALAACYGWGMIKDHPFVDGNKRMGALLLEIFLELNGHELLATDAEAYSVFMEIAGGDFSEEDLAEWVRGNMSALA